jgi:restriction system protein
MIRNFMPVPKYTDAMIPLLKATSDGGEYPRKRLVSALAKTFDLTKEQLEETIPSGGEPLFTNRVGWAITYLVKAKLLTRPRRGIMVITDRGLEVLKSGVERIDNDYLKQFDEFLEFQNLKQPSSLDLDDDNKETENIDTLTPEESLDIAYDRINTDLMAEVLDYSFNTNPFYFEKIVVDLLINLGYGGSRKEAGRAFQKGSDGGIDGIINEDRLGLDVIYVQAKRWAFKNCVGRPEIQKFAGALQGERAKKGIFITTSYFSKEAIEYASKVDSKIILIDGRKFAELMVETNTGVTTEKKFEVKKIDEEYFQEE